jgi:hypothetical protein
VIGLFSDVVDELGFSWGQTLINLLSRQLAGDHGLVSIEEQGHMEKNYEHCNEAAGRSRPSSRCQRDRVKLARFIVKYCLIPKRTTERYVSLTCMMCTMRFFDFAVSK